MTNNLVKALQSHFSLTLLGMGGIMALSNFNNIDIFNLDFKQLLVVLIFFAGYKKDILLFYFMI